MPGMRRKLVLFAVCVIMILPVINAAGEKGRSYNDGVESYNSGNYREAYDIWHSIYTSEGSSFELLFNLGNSCYKLNEISGAIKWYERARLVKPLDENINHNLELAKLRAIDRFNEIPEPFYKTWTNTIALLVRTNQWAVISLILFAVATLFLLVLFLRGAEDYGRIYLTVVIAAAILSLASFLLSVRSKNLTLNNNRAIVTSFEVEGMSAPGEGSGKLFLLHEGTIVVIAGKVGEWYEVRLPDGNIGWIKENSVEII